MSDVTGITFLARCPAWAVLLLLALTPAIVRYVLAVGLIPLVSGVTTWLLSVATVVAILIPLSVSRLDAVSQSHTFHRIRPPSNLTLREQEPPSYRAPPVKLPSLFAIAQQKLVPLIIRDFVKRWHSPIVGDQAEPDDCFEAEVQMLLERVLARLGSRIENLDAANIYGRVVSEFTAHLEAIRLQETKLRGYIDSDDYESDLFLASRYNHFRRLHPAINSLSSDTRPTELSHMRRLSNRIIGGLLPAAELSTKVLRITLGEIVACTVLLPLVDRISEPDFWSELVDRRATILLEEERLISNLRTAVDLEQTKASSANFGKPQQAKKSPSVPFERYLAQIRQIASLVEARTLRNNLKLRIAANTESNQKTEMLRRAIGALDERILLLSTVEHPSAKRNGSNGPTKEVSFSQVLNDPIATSYFSEFLDIRGRGFLIQYHISVDSWKVPLELPGVATASSLSRQDAARFASALDRPIFSFLSPRYLKTLRSFQHGLNSIPELEARQAILESHQAVLEELFEEDWSAFCASKQWRLASAIIAEQQQNASHDEGAMTPFETVAPQPRSPSFVRSSRAVSATSTDQSRSASLGERRAKHADLFGEDSDEDQADKAGVVEHTGAAARDQSADMHLQQLLGGKSGMLSHLDGRSPLFSDPLFDDDQQDVQTVALSSEGTRSSARDEQYVRSETIDALQQTISDLVHTPSADRGKRPGLSSSQTLEPSRAVQELRAAGTPRQTSTSSLQPPRPDLTPRRASAPQIAASTISSTHRVASLDEEAYRHKAAAIGQTITVDLEGEEADRLRKKQQMLTSQLDVLSKLETQYELMGEALKEQQLVEKSIASVRRELEVVLAQLKDVERYALEAARTSITIPTSTVKTDADGKTYNVYHILVCIRPRGGEGEAATWTCYRRYSEFDLLHSALLTANLSQHATFDALFPGKRLVALNFTPGFVESRRSGLEKYLQRVVASSEACSQGVLRRFLREGPFIMIPPHSGSATSTLSASKLSFPGQALVRDLLRGVDDLFFGTTPLVDVLSHHLSGSAAGPGAGAVSSISAEATITNAIPGLSVTQAQAKEAASASKPGNGVITGPLVDLLVELLDLRQDEWRRTAIAVVVQQVLGGTIDRQVRTRLRQLTSEDYLAGLLTSLQESLWPGGVLRETGPKITRAPAASEALKQRARSKIDLLLPQMASLVGREKARKGARRLFNTVTQNRRLNRHLIYTFLDIFVEELFPPEARSRDGV
jgi:sorting nexin-25